MIYICSELVHGDLEEKYPRILSMSSLLSAYEKRMK